MSKYILFLFFLLCLISCNKKEEIKIISHFEVTGELIAEVHPLSVPIFLPRYLGVTEDYLFIYKEREEVLFEIFNLSNYSHVASGGYRGQGPEDFGMVLDTRNFSISGNEFSVMEGGTNLLKTSGIDDKGLQVINVQNIFDKNVSGNGFYSLSKDVYLTFGEPEKNNEYSLYNRKTGEITPVGKYPDWASIDESVPLLFPYMKSCVVHPGGKKFAAFYGRFKRIRIYEDSGNLLNDIEVRIEPYRNDFNNMRQLYSYYQGQPYAIGNYIYVLCGNWREGAIYEDQSPNFELQVWDWDGNPIACYKFDRKIFLMAISEKFGKIYALDNLIENELYVYDLPVLQK